MYSGSLNFAISHIWSLVVYALVHYMLLHGNFLQGLITVKISYVWLNVHPICLLIWLLNEQLLLDHHLEVKLSIQKISVSIRKTVHHNWEWQ